VKRFFRILLGLTTGLWLFIVPSAQAYTQHVWRVPSPDHAQTFVFGSEKNRQWTERGRDHHLAVILNFTNDPYVNSDYPRRYDNFTFSFPGVALGKDGHTFYYHASDGRSIPVASKRPGFLGIEEIKLLPNAALSIEQPHGYLSLSLLVQDAPATVDSE
jgi:hypothetical protein